jgi:ketol-acid reductoisomerase
MMQLTIIGFGNQAKAWGQNLKDSGFHIRVALRSGSPSIDLVKKMGFEHVELGSRDFFDASVFALLIPDHLHEDFLKEHGANFKTGSVILYAHGFSMVHHKFQETFKNIQHVLFAPKAIGTELRRQFTLKGKLGAVYSLEHVTVNKESIEDYLKKFSPALGINMGPFATSFLRETQADLYSEQGLLCSVVPYTAKMMFEHLVSNGVEPELAYFECWHELKLIINAMVDVGPRDFFNLISPNALIGSEKGFQQLMDEGFEKKLKSLYQEIQSGQFEKEIPQTDIKELRQTIKDRWAQSPLQKTFSDLNPETP